MFNVFHLFTGEQAYGAINYAGTWFTTDSTGSDYFGTVFGYVNNRKFYVVMWKGVHYNYGNDTYKAGISGVQLKVCERIQRIPSLTLKIKERM